MYMLNSKFSSFPNHACNQLQSMQFARSVQSIANSRPTLFHSNHFLKELSNSGQIEEARKVFIIFPNGMSAWLHYIVRSGFGTNIYVQSALVNMYAKCGDLNCDKKVLEPMEVDDVVSWNSMIVGCVRRELEDEALLFVQKNAR
ncbi:hypothetical protein K1719_031051 [Acacia pycnantha]|nr:hypothetical protein K1719_031051 [Acacia pycnantha]